MSKLLTEVMADIKIMKATQLELAKQQILEDFEPAIRRIVSAKLEQEGDLDDEGEDFDFAPEDESNPLDNGGGFESFEDDEPDGDEFSMEGDEFGDDDPELAELMRELDGDVEPEEPMMDEGEDEEMNFDEGEDVVDDEMYEAFMAEEFGEDDQLEESDGWEDEAAVEESRKLRTENKKLKKSLRESLMTVSTLKKTMNEVNLLNSKLLYNARIGRKYDLDKKQRTTVLEALDRGRNVREVQLIYATVCESLNKTTSLKRKRSVKEGVGSKQMPFIKPKKMVQESAGVTRMKELAGII